MGIANKEDSDDGEMSAPDPEEGVSPVRWVVSTDARDCGGGICPKDESPMNEKCQ